MPKRPAAHTIGDVAANRVAEIFLSCGWACETIKQDYGEDLLVQPTLNGELDHFRLWIQVKGTKNIARYRTRRFGLSMNIAANTVLKWIRSPELCVVVLWDLTNNTGLWSIPRDYADESKIYLEGAKTIRILFNKKQKLSKKSALKIGWRGRISHFNRLLIEARNNEIEHEMARSLPGFKQSKTSLGRPPIIAFDFLKSVGVIDDEYLHPRFESYVRNAEKNFSRHYPEEPVEERRKQAVMLAVLGRVRDVCGKGVGLPTLLLNVSSFVAHDFVVSKREVGA